MMINLEMYDDQCKRFYTAFRDSVLVHDSIHVQCFNKEEAEQIKKEMAARFPEVPVTVSWLTWK